MIIFINKKIFVKFYYGYPVSIVEMSQLLYNDYKQFCGSGCIILGSWIRIRIHIKVKSRIRIRIKLHDRIRVRITDYFYMLIKTWVSVSILYSDYVAAH